MNFQQKTVELYNSFVKLRDSNIDESLINIDKSINSNLEIINNTYQIKNTIVPEDLKREFWSVIEHAIISLYSDENSFFGQFLIQVKREIDLNITWPVATKPTINGFTMCFNPLIILECTLNEIQAILKHEVYHIIMSHYERALLLKNKYSKEAISIAMDISINQYIKNLPSYYKRLNGVNFQFNLELNGDMTMEKYAEEIQKVIDYREKFNITNDQGNEGDSLISQENAHDLWEKGIVANDTLKEVVKKTAINAYKGKAPKDIEKIIMLMKEKPEIQWNDFLKRLIPSTKSGYRKTITRKDRRMPERVDLRGKLPNTIPKVLVAVDISASMSDKEVEGIVVEVLSIVKSRKAEVKIIEFDSEIRRAYNLTSPKDLKPRSKKNGSTKFSPIFKYIKENNMREHILIIFTDGVGEKELEVKPINSKVLWVLTGDDKLSLVKPYGTIKKLDKHKKESTGKVYGLQELRDTINELRETIHD